MRGSVLVLIAAVAAPSFASANGELAVRTGGHDGEARAITYAVRYLDDGGDTVVDERGITFLPHGGTPFGESTILPERYFGTYPLYVSGGTLRFEVRIRSVSRRTFRNLRVLARQEYLDVGGGWGAPFPDAAVHEWFVERLLPGEEAVLSGSLIIPNLSSSGIDQTHVQILHEARGDRNGGQIIVDDPQAGLWCPTA